MIWMCMETPWPPLRGNRVKPVPHGGKLFDPLYHKSLCLIYKTWTRFTKIHDFVPFGICQDSVKPLLTFFSKKFEIFDIKIFWGSSSIRKISQKIEKIFWKKTQNLKSLWSKGLTKKIWVKSETKIFFRFKGGTLWCFSDFRCLDTQAVINFDGQKWRVRLLWMLK